MAGGVGGLDPGRPARARPAGHVRRHRCSRPARCLLFPGALPITFDTPNLELSVARSSVQFASADDTGHRRRGVGGGHQRGARGGGQCAERVPGRDLGQRRSARCRATVRARCGPCPRRCTAPLAQRCDRRARGHRVARCRPACCSSTGTVSVDGHYISLDYTNIASTVTGRQDQRLGLGAVLRHLAGRRHLADDVRRSVRRTGLALAAVRRAARRRRAGRRWPRPARPTHPSGGSTSGASPACGPPGRTGTASRSPRSTAA